MSFLRAIELVDLNADELEIEVADCIEEVTCLSFKILVLNELYARRPSYLILIPFFFNPCQLTESVVMSPYFFFISITIQELK